jgi:hypothetical protein
VDKHKRSSREEIVALYRRVFGTPDGKAVLRDLQMSFDGNTFDVDPHVSAYKQGQRSVVILINNLLE